jgi:hypothetical protein
VRTPCVLDEVENLHPELRAVIDGRLILDENTTHRQDVEIRLNLHHVIEPMLAFGRGHLQNAHRPAAFNSRAALDPATPRRGAT